LIKNQNIERRFTEFSGHTADTHSGLLTTYQTPVFIIAGAALSNQLEILKLLLGGKRPALKDRLRVEEVGDFEPILSAKLGPSAQLLEKLKFI
jgi:hypothetical protein